MQRKNPLRKRQTTPLHKYPMSVPRLHHQTLSRELCSVIATVKLGEGDRFHDVVDVIFKRDGARGLKEFLDGLVLMLDGFREENAN